MEAARELRPEAFSMMELVFYVSFLVYGMFVRRGEGGRCCDIAYRSMMVMLGAMRAPAHAALVASAPRRQASLSVFHLDLDCGRDWDADVMAMGR